MNFKKITSALLVAGMFSAAFAADGEFGLKGNVQLQATQMDGDSDNNLSSLWVRANIGGQYKSENLDGLVMLRIFAPQFGNSNVTEATIDKDGKLQTKKTAQDKILADLYWANYKWSSDGSNYNLKIGHWKTDWSQSTHFGTYIDKELTARGLWMRDYAHNAIEFGWKSGISQFNAMVATKDNKGNTGYVRFEEDLKFKFPLELKLAYRSNAIDRINKTAYLTHRFATYLSYNFSPAIRVYGEFASIYTQDEKIKKTARNYIAPENTYMQPGDARNPFYIGMEFVPHADDATSLYIEWERIGDRSFIHNTDKKMDDWAWTIAASRKFGKTRIQLSSYSGDKLDDIGLAFRLTTTFK